MQGRYGWDQLNMVLIIGSAAVLMLSRLLAGLGTFAQVLTYVGWAFGLFAVFRMLSRNLQKRQRENIIFMRFANSFTAFFRSFGKGGGKSSMPSENQTENRAESETGSHAFFLCPECGAKLRVPKGQGSIQLKCPRCGNSFRGKS